MSDVFISYASEDRSKAEALARALEAEGLSVWWDRTIPPGGSYDEIIEEALREARCVVTLWSPHAVASRWVRAEAEEAENRRVLVPALIEEVSLPLRFRQIQAANLAGWEGESDHPELRRLMASVAARLGEAPAPSPAPQPEPAAGPAPARSRPRRPPVLLAVVVLLLLAMAGVGYYAYEQSRRLARMEDAQQDAAAKQKAEDKARRMAEIEAKRKADEEAKRKTDVDAKRKADAEARRQADEEARRKAALEARRRAEAERKIFSTLDDFIAKQPVDRSNPAWKSRLRKPPIMTFPRGTTFYWTLETSVGNFAVELFPGAAPMHVSNTIYLTRFGFYDGTLFDRVVPGFMAQGGDPTGRGTGGPGYQYDGTFRSGLKHDERGIVSAANRGPGTDGSRFLITFAPAPKLDGSNTIFGKVVKGVNILETLEKAGSRTGRPTRKIVVRKASIQVSFR